MYNIDVSGRSIFSGFSSTHVAFQCMTQTMGLC